jgi:hypothetical protein
MKKMYNQHKIRNISSPSFVIMKGVLLVSCLLVASAALVPVAFTSLESCTKQKLVIFHDPSVEESVAKLGVIETIDSSGTYGTEYQYTVCDVTSEENTEKIKTSGMKDFPALFTQTVEGGIEPFHSDLTVESFAAFHEFRTMDLTQDNVMRMKDSAGKGNVDGVTEMLELASKRPVFVKMYEVTPHSQLHLEPHIPKFIHKQTF